MKLVLTSAAIIIATSASGAVAADGRQRRLRHSDTSEDKSYAAAKGWRGDHISNVHGHHVVSGGSYGGNVRYGGGPHPAHHSCHTHHSHYAKATKQQEKDYYSWCQQNWGKCQNLDSEDADLLADFFDKYEDEDIKVVSDFLRARAEDEYDESYDSGEYYYNYN